jgi:hexokinase
LAQCIDDFLNKVPELRNKHLPFGFTFSFSYDQIALDKAIITRFGLETDLPEAIGNDAVQYLREAIERKGLNIKIMSISNDTTAVLAFGLYMKPEAAIGFILGTGTNICYLERVDRIKKIDPIATFGSDVKHVIINTECGFIGDNGSMNFAKTKFDFEIDEESRLLHNCT